MKPSSTALRVTLPKTIVAVSAVALLLAAAPMMTQSDSAPVAAPGRPAKREAAVADAALAPLAFLEGRWETTLPNGMVSEESWLPVRGKSMLGSFRQTRPDGMPAFFEFTQIVAEKSRVVLRQIHVHGSFDTDERRKDPMVLQLSKAETNNAIFVPVTEPEQSHSADLASITYTRKDAETLVLRIESRPVKDSKNPDAPAKPQVIELFMKRAR